MTKRSLNSAVFGIGLLAIVALAGCLSAKLSTNNAAVQVRTKIKEIGQEIVMSVILENQSREDVIIPRGHLPWDTYGMVIVLTEAEPVAIPLSEPPLIEDPVPGEPWRIRSGERLAGKIDLSHRFPDLVRVLQHSDVILFWSYYIEGTSKSERLSGSELIGSRTE